MALGARQEQVLSVVIRQGFRWVLLGRAADVEPAVTLRAEE